MNKHEMAIIHIAKHESGCTSRALSNLIGSSAKRRCVTKRLEERGIVERFDGVKRSGQRWFLTEKGQDLLQEIASAQPTTTESARTAVLASLVCLGISRRELARRAAVIGECSEVAVLQWLGGQTNSPTLRTWFAIEAALQPQLRC